MSPVTMTAHQLATAFRKKECSAREAVEAHLAHIAEKDSTVGAFISINDEAALAMADAADADLAAGKEPGPLAGVPVAVKDNICLRGVKTTCASKALTGFAPPYSAHAADALIQAGAIPVGKTNLDEFAMGSSTENSGVQPTRNPWNPERVPGGSSGGSAAAVAAGFVPLALGSDTGGSIRQPASFCGVVGMKPSYGLVSRYGLVAFGSSLDQIGPLARTVEDAALLFKSIAGHDPRDSTSRPAPAPDPTPKLKESIKGMRVGLPKEYFDEAGLDEPVRKAVLDATETMREQGAELVEVSLPMLEYAVPTYYIIATAEASSNLARYDGAHYGHRSDNPEGIVEMFSQSRKESFGDEVKRRIMLGNYVLSAGYYDAYYLRALKVRTLIARDFEKVFAGVDLIASPVSPSTAFRIGERTTDPLKMYLSDIYTISANLAALPAISVPCGYDDEGLPIGLQLLGQRFKDDALFQAAWNVEHALGGGNAIVP